MSILNILLWCQVHGTGRDVRSIDVAFGVDALSEISIENTQAPLTFQGAENFRGRNFRKGTGSPGKARIQKTDKKALRRTEEGPETVRNLPAA
ncbi:MAG: hypothetical protein LBQ15_12530 [Clostridium sp.]|nr:hypothetical protein [Clostridium sp.]